MKWNYKKKEKPRFEFQEVANKKILKLLKLKKETKRAVALVDEKAGKVLKLNEGKRQVKRNVKRNL